MRTILFILLIFIIGTLVKAQKKVVCYYGSWSIYRPGNGKFNPPEHLDPYLCTHAIYSFIGLNLDGTVRIMDEWNDISSNGFANFNGLRYNNPNLKTLIAIGGWNEGSTKFSSVCANAAIRANFVNNLYNFVKQHNFNGLDLDWEYPTQRGGSAADKANFVSLVKELKAKFSPEGLLLTAAVSANVHSLGSTYDVPQLANYLDFINVMTYDFHGSWEPKTGQNAPLYASSIDADKTLNVDASVTAWLNAGTPPSKLILGMGTYGRTWTLQSATGNGLGAATAGAGVQGPYTQEAGFLGYNEICEKQKTETGWTIKFDTQQQVPYAYRNTLWVGYDNVDSVRIKTEYINNRKLGGAMFWSIETDDFRNICGTGKFPLINKVKSTLI